VGILVSTGMEGLACDKIQPNVAVAGDAAGEGNRVHF
jgi:hypothetical protein